MTESLMTLVKIINIIHSDTLICVCMAQQRRVSLHIFYIWYQNRDMSLYVIVVLIFETNFSLDEFFKKRNVCNEHFDDLFLRILDKNRNAESELISTHCAYLGMATILARCKSLSSQWISMVFSKHEKVSPNTAQCISMGVREHPCIT